MEVVNDFQIHQRKIRGRQVSTKQRNLSCRHQTLSEPLLDSWLVETRGFRCCCYWFFLFLFMPQKDLPIGHKDVMSYTEEGHAWLWRRLNMPDGNLVLNMQHSSLSHTFEVLVSPSALQMVQRKLQLFTETFVYVGSLEHQCWVWHRLWPWRQRPEGHSQGFTFVPCVSCTNLKTFDDIAHMFEMQLLGSLPVLLCIYHR